jgi:hypothetical protein
METRREFGRESPRVHAGRQGVVVRDVFPDPDDIVRRKRMKAKALLCAH